MLGRNETRRERILIKEKMGVKSFPFEVATINFQTEENVAFVVRSAVCFGFNAVNVIGALPKHKILRSKSGSTEECIKINQFSNINKFLCYIRENNIDIVSCELTKDAVSIYDFKFNFDRKICLITGHETLGVPQEILMNSKHTVYIDMPGKGFCLNTSVCSSLMMYEIIRQYNEQL